MSVSPTGVPVFGQLASVSTPSGAKCYFNSIQLTITQGVATALPPFGGTWTVKRGTVCQYAGAVSGAMSSGADASNPDISLTPICSQTGNAFTVNFSNVGGKICGLSDTAIFSSLGLSTAVEGVGNTAFAFEGPSSFAGPTLAWVATLTRSDTLQTLATPEALQADQNDIVGGDAYAVTYTVGSSNHTVFVQGGVILEAQVAALDKGEDPIAAGAVAAVEFIKAFPTFDRFRRVVYPQNVKIAYGGRPVPNAPPKPAILRPSNTQ